MITDKETNYLYLAHCLPHKYGGFSSLLEKALLECSIPYSYIPQTKDVWAVDYMPIQVTRDKFVQFTYAPDYLQGAKKWRESISDVEKICHSMGLKPTRSTIVLDGGNVVRAKNKAILCSKIFKENSSISPKQLIKELEVLFEVDQIIFVPQAPGDKVGHADGMVRFLDDKTVLVNDYSREKQEFQLSFHLALHNAGLECIELPYNPYGNKTNWQANGMYINYLEMNQALLVPVFEMDEDEKAVKQLESLFPKKVRVVYSNEIALDGGILNCVTWNIQK